VPADIVGYIQCLQILWDIYSACRYCGIYTVPADKRVG